MSAWQLLYARVNALPWSDVRAALATLATAPHSEVRAAYAALGFAAPYRSRAAAVERIARRFTDRRDTLTRVMLARGEQP